MRSYVLGCLVGAGLAAAIADARVELALAGVLALALVVYDRAAGVTGKRPASTRYAVRGRAGRARARAVVPIAFVLAAELVLAAAVVELVRGI